MKVSICGCGWLGLPLAYYLKKQGMIVQGTKRTPEGIQALCDADIMGFPLTLPLISESLSELDRLFDCDVMVVNIPPGRKGSLSSHYTDSILTLCLAAKRKGCQQLIFISTTAVYGEQSGVISEATLPMPTTESGKAHYEIEQSLIASWGDKVTILRLAGLIGPNRHPVKFLSGRTGIEQGGAPVNLIHQQDCIQAITAIIRCQPKQNIFHLAASQHPSRADYYTAMAKIAGLAVPEFIDICGESGKTIDATLTCDLLNLVLEKDDLMQLKPELDDVKC
ncbi:SDR family oxidoreductase [Photobacterium kagoshimensis]|uniref:SDR family oxidoreductase n=1 Tax=Photobacterium kagoshimensis TaxID=2910242 RepID=UPI003D0E8994